MAIQLDETETGTSILRPNMGVQVEGGEVRHG